MSYMDCCDWSRCTRCGECLARCPMMNLTREEAGRAVGNLIDGVPEPAVLDACSLCMSCNRLCPEGLRPHELILERLREHTGRTRRVPGVIPYLLNSFPGPNLFRDYYRKRLTPEEKGILRRWSEVPPPSRDVLFVGCIGKTLCGDLERSTVLRDLPRFGPPDVCCGELHYRSGMWDAYADMAEKTCARLSRLRAERIVFYCAACRTYLGPVMENVLGRKLPFELTTLYEWLLERVEQGVLELKRPLGFRAAVHDFCNASELGHGFQDRLRALYRAAGMETVELEHSRDVNVSCGGGALLGRLRPGDLVRIQRKRYGEAKRAGAGTLALNCPGCYLAFFPTSRLHGVRIRYMPEELLRAFGDEIRTPLGTRVPRIARTFLAAAPRMLKPVDAARVRVPR